MGKVKDALLGMSTLVISVGVQIIVLMIYLTFLTVKIVLEGHSAEGDELVNLVMLQLQDSNTLMTISAVCAIINIVIFSIWYWKKLRVKNAEKGILNIRWTAGLLLMGIGIQFGLSMVLTFISAWQPSWFEYYNEMIGQFMVDQSGWIVVVYAGIIAPIAEELTFRGVAYGYFRKLAPWSRANVLQALLFGIMHMNPVQGVYAFVIGILLGYVYEKFGDIKASVLLHMFINLSAYLLQALIPDTVSVSIFVMAGILLLSVGSCIVVINRMQKMGKENLMEEQ